MTKVFLRSKQKYQHGSDGAFAVPSGLSSTTAGRYRGTDGEVFNTTTGAQASNVNISSSTNATPIVVTSSGNHGLFDGQTVIIANHTTNTNANGTWLIHVLSATTFSLNTSVGNGVGGATGTITPVIEGNRDIIAIPSITGTSHGNFTSSDLGRMMKLTTTPPSSGSSGTRKHDNWVFRIIEIVSTTQVRLEGARFEDASTVGAGAVTWTLMACSQFTSATASFSSDPVAGAGGNAVDKHITIPNPISANLALKYVPLRIGTVIDGTNLLVNDWTGNLDVLPTGSSLAWFLHDRQAYNPDDLYMILHRFLLQTGWNVKGARATGTIIAGASPVTGDWVTIWDGSQRYTFEWTNGAPGANHTAVAFVGGNATTNATNLATAISGVGNLTAISSTATVTVTCQLYSSRGNTLIFRNSGFSVNSFGAVTGMTGGTDAGQFRGRNNGVAVAAGTQNDGVCEDVIYFSNGEDDPANPRRMYFRTVRWNDNGSGNGHAQSAYGIDFAFFQSWNNVYSNGTTHNRGNGINPVKTPFQVTQSDKGAVQATFAYNSTTVSAWSSNTVGSIQPPFPSIGTYFELVANPLGIYGGEHITINYAFFGDKNEFVLFIETDGYGSAFLAGGALKAINQNNQRFMVKVAATAGSTVAIQVGPNLDPTAVVSPRDGGSQIAIPYQVNDELQSCGLTVASGAPTGGAFIESGQITSLGAAGAGATNPDGLDYTITVGTLNRDLSVGDIVGEEANPVFFWAGPHYSLGTAGEARSQNAAQHGDGTYFDWNGDGFTSTTDGFDMTAGMGTIGTTNSIEEVNPNHRGGRWGYIPVVFRNTTEGEFRGTMSYVGLISARLGSSQWIPDRNGNWYYTFTNGFRQNSTSSQYKYAVGPLSQALARPF